MIARAEQGGVEHVVILQPDFSSFRVRHPSRLRRRNPAVPIAGLLEIDVVVMNLAALVQIVPARIRQHVHLFIVRSACPHERLPLHKFIAEFSGIRPDEQIASGSDSLTQTREKKP